MESSKLINYSKNMCWSGQIIPIIWEHLYKLEMNLENIEHQKFKINQCNQFFK